MWHLFLVNPSEPSLAATGLLFSPLYHVSGGVSHLGNELQIEAAARGRRRFESDASSPVGKGPG